MFASLLNYFIHFHFSVSHLNFFVWHSSCLDVSAYSFMLLQPITKLPLFPLNKIDHIGFACTKSFFHLICFVICNIIIIITIHRALSFVYVHKDLTPCRKYHTTKTTAKLFILCWYLGPTTVITKERPI